MPQKQTAAKDYSNHACLMHTIAYPARSVHLATSATAQLNLLGPRCTSKLRGIVSMAESGRGPGSNPRQLLSVAPMMDWTDLHFRQLVRLLSKRTWLWTEMVVDKTLIHTQQLDRFLWFPPEQHPIVCQLGGSEPDMLAAAVRKVVQYGYDEINLNCGCPSDRVAGAGCFGAALMLEPELVARCMAAMAEAADGTPVNVKCRLGVDQVDSYEALHRFIETVSTRSPVTHFIIHARKCFLKGLNPHQNRTIPPLRYEWVYGLKRDFPHLSFSLNGGVAGAYEAVQYLDYAGPFTAAAGAVDSPSCSNDHSRQSQEHVENGDANRQDWLEGIMIGRQAYNDPWGVLADADRAVFGEANNPATSRRQVLQQYADYASRMQGRWAEKEDGHQEPGVRVMMKAILNLFHGEKGSKRWKSEVDTVLKAKPPSVEYVLQHTLHLLPDEVLDAPPRQGPCILAGQQISSLAAPAKIVLPRLPTAKDRAGHNQDPEGVDTKRGGPQVVLATARKQEDQVDVDVEQCGQAAGISTVSKVVDVLPLSPIVAEAQCC